MSVVGLRARLGFGLGGAMFSIKEAAYSVFVLLFYTQVLGLSGTAAGIALAAAVVFDCLSDPFIGAWSDRLESRWGRRHPLMVAGTLPMGVGFIGLFAVPDTVVASQWQLALWLLFWSIWIRTALSVFAIPHLALSAQMTSDYRERSAILGTRLFFLFLAAVLLPAAALALLFNETGGVDGRFVRENYPVYGWISCVLTLAVGLSTIWFTRGYAASTAGASHHGPPGGGPPGGGPPGGGPPGGAPPRGYLADFLQTLQVRNFRQLLAFDIAASVSYGILIATHMLAYIYFWELTSTEIALLLAIPSLLGVSAAMLVVRWVGRRLAKHTILRLTCAAMIVDGVWPYALRLVGWMPDNGHPVVFQALFLQMLLWMFFFILRGIASQSLTADIADENELVQGRRQEGALFAASMFTQKLATAIGPLYGGAVLDLIGLRQGMAPGSIDHGVLTGFAVYSLLGVTVPLLAALYFSFRVSLSEQYLNDIQARLAAQARPGVDTSTPEP